MQTGAVVLKEDDLQFITDADGDIPADNPNGRGLYFRDTRFLNRFELWVNGEKPVFLSNSSDKRYIATFQYVNPPLILGDGRRVKRQSISIRRSRFVTAEGLYERIGFMNCNQFDVELDLVVAVEADFRDMFAVRGFKTQRVAGEIAVSFGGEDLRFVYHGRDDVPRCTRISFSRAPDEAISAREVRFFLKLAPHQMDSIVVLVQPCIGEEVPDADRDFDHEVEALAASYREWDASSTAIASDNELFDRGLLRASRYDLRTLLERTPWGLIPDAGVPWYAVPFGRDAIVTALQTLMYNPAIAEGTLRFLAQHQGTAFDDFREEEPGKIMHELRRGELARLREVPHTPYYGTVDATPLFLVLFVETMDWLDSDSLFDDIFPHALRALEWIDRYGDVDGDGYVEYVTHRPGGVQNQGWKDSVDAVQYEDGRSATHPIAIVEVQGYVYHAKSGLARLLRRRGRDDLASRLEAEADALKERFNRDFWLEDEQFFALALDADKRQVRSVTSNAGHLLWSGICEPERAEAVARRLVAPDMFSGWGIRTISTRSPNYNPMSYHNGSVWPHDTAIIALGLRRSGFAEEAMQVASSLIEAGFRVPDGRLPELFCGFGRDTRFNSSPAEYIVSCSPQAWAAGCIFMLLQTLLGLRPNAAEGVIHLSPWLPTMFRRLELNHMRVGDERVSLVVEGAGEDVSVELQSGLGLQLDAVPV